MKTILLKKEIILSFIILIFCGSQNIYAQTGPNENGVNMQSFVLQFSNVNGPTVNRELNLAFSESTTDGFDEGYDIKNFDNLNDDLNLNLDGEPYTSLAYSAIVEGKTVPLMLNTSGNYSYSVEMTSMSNMGNYDIELLDNLTGITFSLRTGGTYTFTSNAGYFDGRFEITLKSSATLSQTDFEIDNIDARYINNTNTIVISNPMNQSIKNVEMYSITGKRVFNNNTLSSENSIKYQARNLNTGIYIIRLETENNGVITKKVLIKQ